LATRVRGAVPARPAASELRPPRSGIHKPAKRPFATLGDAERGAFRDTGRVVHSHSRTTNTEGKRCAAMPYPFNALVYRRLGLFQPRTDVWTFVAGVVLAGRGSSGSGGA